MIDLPGGSRPNLSPPGPGEWLLVLLIFAVGCGMRFAWPDRMAVEHFDEGIYASNVWFGPDVSFRYPEQHLYAPPLLPTLIEWIFTLAGPSNFGAMLPSLVAGSLTIPLLWWIGRSWFGPTAGIGAAMLCALSDAHIAFSRSALTDVLLCFWVLLAVHLTWRALTSGGLWSPLGAGLFTGIAWWTKYSGWLPLAIGTAGLVPWLIQCRFSQGESASLGRLIRILSRLAAIVAIAVALWSPWLWSLQSQGGYAAVAANHAKYVVGVSGWWQSAVEQTLKLQELSGTATANGLLIALIASAGAALLTTPRFTWNEAAGAMANHAMPYLSLILLMIVGQKLLGPAPVYLGAGGLGLAFAHIRHWSNREGDAPSLAAWMLTAWFIGMAVSTPAYTPYPRLLLPFQVASWLAVGLLIQHGVLAVFHREPEARSEPSIPNGPVSSVRLAGVVVLWLALFTSVASGALPLRVPGWADRSAIQSAAADFKRLAIERAASTAGPESPLVIYTISEPALLFQLRLQGLEHVRPVSSLRLAHPEAPRPTIPTFIMLGKQARSMPDFESQQWKTAEARLEEIDSETIAPSPLVRLDDADWSMPVGADRSPLSLFELR